MFTNQLNYSLIIFPCLMFFAIFVAKNFDLFDKPNTRKLHKTKVVNIAGITIYIYLLFLIALTEFSELLEQIIVAGFIVVVIGFIDDRKELRPQTKLFFL